LKWENTLWTLAIDTGLMFLSYGGGDESGSGINVGMIRVEGSVAGAFLGEIDFLLAKRPLGG